jgi:hypothetical protein
MYFVFFFGNNLFCVIVRFCSIGALDSKGFLLYYFVLHLLIVNFLVFVFTGEYRFVKPNHLNLNVVCN